MQGSVAHHGSPLRGYYNAVGRSTVEVVKTLRDAIILVAVVVLLFLQNWRSTLIPLIAVPVRPPGPLIVARRCRRCRRGAVPLSPTRLCPPCRDRLLADHAA